MPHDVFISHSSKDKLAADALCAALENARIRCWIAPRDVLPGRPFPGEITRAIEQCKIVVLVFSSSSNCSEDVLREMQLAAKNRCHIINFRIENVQISEDLDYYLSVPHWLDALTPPMERCHAQLIQSVRALMALDRRSAQSPAADEAGSAEPPPIPKQAPPPGDSQKTNTSTASRERSDPWSIVRNLFPGASPD
jgi:hypothetical protein